MNMDPFLGTEAVAAGLFTRRTLVSRNVMIHQNVYLPKGVKLSAETRAMAAWLWSGRRATIAGLSAAAWHGSKWIDAALPAELIRPVPCKVNGIVIHRDCLVETETCVVRGVAATTPARTAYDRGRRGTLMQAVMRLDALANATDLKPEDVAALLSLHRGARGLPQLRDVIALMDGGAESPQETRTRLLLIAAGFPRPETQIVVCDDFGQFVGRVDLGYRKWRVAIEYDGPLGAPPPEGQGDIGMVPQRTLATSRGSLTSKPKGGSSFGSPATSFDIGGAPSSRGFGMRCATEDGLTTRQSG